MGRVSRGAGANTFPSFLFLLSELNWHGPAPPRARGIPVPLVLFQTCIVRLLVVQLAAAAKPFFTWLEQAELDPDPNDG